jgi:hypothetical protein
MKKSGKTHLYIPDPQVRPGSPVNHLDAAGNMAVELKPDTIICGGDFWDMHSLSSYDQGTIAGEGSRYKDDIEAGNAAMDVLMYPIRKFQSTKSGKDYRPRMIFTLGNHENRILKHMQAHPFLEGVLGNDLNLRGWKVYKFLELAEADGVFYTHYFYSPMTGKSFGGTAQNVLSKVGISFTMGHVQKLDYARKDLPNGKVINGLIGGAFYQHDEVYKGPQGNHHWRGVVVKRDVKDGDYDLEVWNIERVLRVYG